MTISIGKKKELVAQYGKSEADTGATAVQVAILTERIRGLTTHLPASGLLAAEKSGSALEADTRPRASALKSDRKRSDAAAASVAPDGSFA